MKILGISAYYHDTAAAIIVDGKIIAAAQEERFARIKHDKKFPLSAIRYCLDEAKISIAELDAAVFYENPEKKFLRLVKTYLSFAPEGYASFMKSMPSWLGEKLHLKSLLVKQLQTLGDFRPDRLQFTEHHLSHAASAFFPSPFPEAAILVIDGVGESATTSIGHGKNNGIILTQQLHFPHSLGLLYAAFTYYLGFKVNSGEYKVMGLAPYGKPIYADKIFQHLVDLKPDGSFRLDQRYFNYCTGLTMTNRHFDALFGGAPRQAEATLTQREFDLAASIQAVTEAIILRIARHIAKTDTTGNLCMAGGVALNCVANGKILQDGHFDRIWIQPAAGDAGNALGAAWVAHHIVNRQPRHAESHQDAMRGGYLGPQFGQTDCETRLAKLGGIFEVYDDDTLITETVTALISGKVVGWFQGRMEFGPRALGNRSILADPRVPGMQTDLNLKIKFRESFRPFAPSVLAEDAADWFELAGDSPYMLLVASIKASLKIPMTEAEQALSGIDKLKVCRSAIPSVTHVDDSARVQTVHQDTNPRYHRLLSAFKQRTGCPVLVNTSFNVRGEPIVGTPDEAFVCFMSTGMDVLVVGNCLLHKERQPPSLFSKPIFEPD